MFRQTFELRKSSLAMRCPLVAGLLALAMLTSRSHATDLVELEKLTAANRDSNDRFGQIFAMQGDVALLAASGDDDEASGSGAVYVYGLEETGWVEAQKLTASDAGMEHQFGSSVAIDGDVAVIGAVFANGDVGAAYVFRYDGMTWAQEQQLTPGDGQPFDLFGVSTAVSGDSIFVGARGHNGERGAAYAYRFDGTMWNHEQKLVIPDGQEEDVFGEGIVLDGNDAIISARLENNFRGSVYVFEFDGTSWVQQQELVGSAASSSHVFGASLALQGDELLIGASGDGAGSVYAFTHDGTTWSETDRLVASGLADFDQFGAGVALDGNAALVGAFRADGAQGAAFLFRREEGIWVERQKIRASDGVAGDSFGRNVALQNGRALVSSENDDVIRGAAYAYFAPFCAEGSVNAGAGSTFNVLAIEGSSGGDDRKIEVPAGEFIDVTLVRPGLGGNGKFVLQAHAGEPGPVTVSLLPFSIGSSCFPFLIADGSDPLLIANNIGKASAVGASHFQGTPWEDPEHATTTFTYPDLPAGLTVTFQAILVDPGSLSSKGVSTTNAVVVEVMP